MTLARFTGRVNEPARPDLRLPLFADYHLFDGMVNTGAAVRSCFANLQMVEVKTGSNGFARVVVAIPVSGAVPVVVEASFLLSQLESTNETSPGIVNGNGNVRRCGKLIGYPGFRVSRRRIRNPQSGDRRDGRSQRACRT